MKNKQIVKVIHRVSDPTSWIVNVYEPAFPFKKKVLSRFFNSGEEVKKFVARLNLETFDLQ